MPTYSKNDFTYANNALSTLEQDCYDTQNLIEIIHNFKTGSIKQLKGEVWDNIRNALDTYITALQLRKDTCNKLYNQFKSVNNMVIAAIGNNDSINTDRLEELRITYNHCAKLLSNGQETTNDYQDIMYETKALIKQIEEMNRVEGEALNSLAQLASDSVSYKTNVESITTTKITTI